MLTNILNTLAITCSLGTSILKTTKEQRIDRSGNTQNYSLNIQWNEKETIQEEQQYGFAYTENTIHFVYQETKEVQTGTFNNNSVRGYVKRLMLTARVNRIENQKSTNIIGKGRENLNSIIIQKGDYNLYMTQEMYIFAVEGLQNQLGNQLNINTTYYGINPSGNYTNKVYGKLLSTTNANMEGILQKQNTYYFENNNLYDGLTKITYAVSGYTSAINEYIYNTITQNNNTIINQNIDIAVQNKRTNYYVLYLEPRSIEDVENTYVDTTIYNLQAFKNPYNQTGTTNTATITGNIIVANIEIEVIDVGGIMFDVLGMPFTFLSTAFNLTLFANTPYAINISTIFLSIVAVAIFVFVVRIITGVVSKAG